MKTASGVCPRSHPVYIRSCTRRPSPVESAGAAGRADGSVEGVVAISLVETGPIDMEETERGQSKKFRKERRSRDPLSTQEDNFVGRLASGQFLGSSTMRPRGQLAGSERIVTASGGVIHVDECRCRHRYYVEFME